MNVLIEVLPLLFGSLIGAAMPGQPGPTKPRVVWVCLGFLGALLANLSSGEGLSLLPVDVLLVSGSAFAVYKVKQLLVGYY